MVPYYTPPKYMTVSEIIKELKTNGLSPFQRNPFLLQWAWNEYKRDFEILVKKTGLIKDFNSNEINLAFHLNENEEFGYNPTLDRLELNILSFFLRINPDEDAIFYDMDFHMTALLIHELDHRLYAQEHDIIGLSEAEREEFDKEHVTELETRAWLKYSDFVKKYGKIVGDDIIICRYTGNSPMPERNDAQRIIQTCLNHAQNEMNRVKSPENYDNEAIKQANSTINRFGRILKINIEKTEHPKEVVCIPF